MKDKGHLDQQIQPSDITSSPMVWWHWHQWSLFSYLPSSIPWQHSFLSTAKEGKALSMQRAFGGRTAAHWDPDPSLLPSPAPLPCQVVQESGADPWNMVATQLEEEKNLNCWITPHAPISVQGRYGERTCSCHQICNLPLITYDQLIFYPLLYVSWHWETITALMLVHR